MTDPSEHSGSRWEPTEHATTAGQATTSSGGGGGLPGTAPDTGTGSVT